MRFQDNGKRPAKICISPCAGESELSDPLVTGFFAPEMSLIAVQLHRPPWCGYIGRCDGVPMGYGGFKSSPSSSGEVEIGYLTFPNFEDRGVASAITAAMISIARQENIRTVSAHTLATENASTGVLRRNGFVRDAESHDPEEGIVWRWRLDL